MSPGLGEVRCFRQPMAFALALLAVSAISASARPAPPGVDPDWPCQARLVPKLAAVNYWSGPLDIRADWHADPDIAKLVDRLGPRRVTTEEGLGAIAEFAKTLSGDRGPRLALLFIGLLEQTNLERAALIEKLKGIGRRQRELADLVARLGDQLDAIPLSASGDAAARRIDLQQRHDFTVRNFEEIQRTIRYACEDPVQLDARLGAWARALQKAASR